MTEENEEKAIVPFFGAEEALTALSGGESDFTDDDFDEKQKRRAKTAGPEKLYTLSLTELYQISYHSKPPIIESLLCVGVYILAGAPKIGKSFLVTQLAYHVSTGERLWGIDVRQGSVLYLALEDSFQRIQSRMFKMYGVNDADALHFATTAGKLGNGLEEQLENFVSERPDTRLIIVDTMQKIRASEKQGYAGDYEIIGKLKAFADDHGLCVLLVHHTRKQPAADSFNTISGSTGLLGSADGAIMMKKKTRSGTEAVLEISGRDLPDQVLYLKRNIDTLLWDLQSAENDTQEQPPDPILESAAALVSPDHPVWSGSPTEFAEAIHAGMAANTLTKYMNVNAGRLMEERNVRYENKPRHEGRKVILTYMVVDTVEYRVLE